MHDAASGIKTARTSAHESIPRAARVLSVVFRFGIVCRLANRPVHAGVGGSVNVIGVGSGTAIPIEVHSARHTIGVPHELRAVQVALQRSLVRQEVVSVGVTEEIVISVIRGPVLNGLAIGRLHEFGSRKHIDLPMPVPVAEISLPFCFDDPIRSSVDSDVSIIDPCGIGRSQVDVAFTI